MKVLFTIFGILSLLILSSCDQRIIPIKNNYQDKVYEFTVSQNKDEVWNKLIEFFMEKGIVINTIDKNDGLITTGFTSFINSYTWENKEGNLMNPNALVVVSRYRGAFTLGSSAEPTTVTGQWLIRVKEGNNKTGVSVKLANGKGTIGSSDIDSQGHVTSTGSFDLPAKSTGVFEREIENALK